MNGEFSFDGKSCTEFGLHYIPDADDRWYSSPEYSMLDDEVTGRSGGYWYGTKVGIRDFKLACYFEDATVEKLEAIYRWLSRHKEAKLVFDERPYVYYIVRPVLPSSGQVWWHDYFKHYRISEGSGKLTLNFKAYEPFGYLSYSSYDTVDEDRAAQRCGMLKTAMMPAGLSPAVGDYLVYNPGSEVAYPTIRIAGSAPNGLTLRNDTTGKTCTLLPFNLAKDTYLEINGKSGLMTVEPSGTTAFEYHADGYLDLASCQPYDRDVVVTTTADSAQIRFDNYYLSAEDVGRYVYVSGGWHRILYVHEGGGVAEIDAAMTRTATEISMIAVLNRIFVEGDDLALTSLTMDFTPMVR